MKTLLLLAGCAGAGKSTLLDLAYANAWPIFGDRHQKAFQSINADRIPQTHDFKTALQHNTHFHAAHLPQLRVRDSLPATVLIHIDLHNLLKNLCIVHARDREKVKRVLVRFPRDDSNLLFKKLNDFLLRDYLDDPFFKRFDKIAVNTLLCEFNKNQEQFSNRTQRKLFDTTPEMAIQIHQELYDCWRRNIACLKPDTVIESQFIDGQLQQKELVVPSRKR